MLRGADSKSLSDAAVASESELSAERPESEPAEDSQVAIWRGERNQEVRQGLRRATGDRLKRPVAGPDAHLGVTSARA